MTTITRKLTTQKNTILSIGGVHDESNGQETSVVNRHKESISQHQKFNIKTHILKQRNVTQRAVSAPDVSTSQILAFVLMYARQEKEYSPTMASSSTQPNPPNSSNPPTSTPKYLPPHRRHEQATSSSSRQAS